MAANAPSGEDTRVWIGKVRAGSELEHERFLEWLQGPEAQEIFRRRRLNEYVLSQEDGTVTIVFKAPHTGDPRIMIDFLRYPGLWPDFWEFVQGGTEPPELPEQAIRVHWQRDA